MRTLKQLLTSQNNRRRLYCEELEGRDTPNAFAVNTTDDTPDANLGDGFAKDANNNTSLRAAVQEANELTGTHTIGFGGLAGTNTITLTANLGGLEINGSTNVTFNGPGVGSLFVTREPDPNVPFSLIYVNQGSTSAVNNLTLIAGWTNSSGGGITNEGTLTVSDSKIEYCEASDGGAIANYGSLTVQNTNLLHNTATSDGGALLCAATSSSVTQLTSCTIAYNNAVKGGGIAELAAATLTINGGSIHDNWVDENNGVGGGIYVSGGTLSDTGCGISSNSAPTGAGLYNSGGNCLLRSLTVSDNQASHIGGGIYAKLGTTTMEACTFFGNGDMMGAPKVAYKGILGSNTFISVDAECVGITADDFVQDP